ncbi:MAG: hypothetical protein GY822_23230 [Deltaproteobacteria bacterium]|nr:hypothetical protein [Deltaproteobacteria bacterium]
MFGAYVLLDPFFAPPASEGASAGEVPHSVFTGRQIFERDVSGPVEITVLDEESAKNEFLKNILQDAYMREDVAHPQIIQTLEVFRAAKKVVAICESRGGWPLDALLNVLKEHSQRMNLRLATAIVLQISDVFKALEDAPKPMAVQHAAPSQIRVLPTGDLFFAPSFLSPEPEFTAPELTTGKHANSAT